MNADELARRVALLDEEIARLHAHAKVTTDAFEYELDRAQIDELLEERHALAPGSDPD